MTTDFCHHPTRKQLTGAYINPVHNKPLWDRIWAAARHQPWFDADIGLVGGDGVTFYFQKRGCTTGFAAVRI